MSRSWLGVCCRVHQEHFTRDRLFPLRDQCLWVSEEMFCASFWQLLSALFCSSETAQESLGRASLGESGALRTRWASQACSSWKRAQDLKGKGAEGGEEDQVLSGKERLPVSGASETGRRANIG